MIDEILDDLIEHAVQTNDYEELSYEFLRIFSIEPPFSQEELKELPKQELQEKAFKKVLQTFEERNQRIIDQVLPVIQHLHETQGHQYKLIGIPFHDGKKTIHITVNLEKAIQSKGKEVIKELEKNVILASIDEEWREHLRALDDLKQSVQNAVYEQKDPLLIYKLESFNLFKSMIHQLDRNILSFLFKASVPGHNEEEIRGTSEEKVKKPAPKLKAARTPVHELAGNANPSRLTANRQDSPKQQQVRVEKKINRNDPCPCGSGKKYKQCHGR
jgi:preprotein translocase subunit SecA